MYGFDDCFSVVGADRSVYFFDEHFSFVGDHAFSCYFSLYRDGYLLFCCYYDDFDYGLLRIRDFVNLLKRGEFYA